jgi:hypothetical protein
VTKDIALKESTTLNTDGPPIKGMFVLEYGELTKNERKITHLQRKVQWVERDYRHFILIGRITQIYERRLRINMVGENLLVDLHKTQNNIGNRCCSF